MSNFFDTTFGEVTTGFFGHSLEDYLGFGGGPSVQPPSPTPSPAANNRASLYAQQQVRRQALLRRTLQSTVHAGIGSWYPAVGQLGPGQTGAAPSMKR